jgi:hypothetical protein
MITWGECGHPLRNGHPCNVCWLLGLSPQWVSDWGQDQRCAVVDAGLCAHTATQARRRRERGWHGREDEAHAWRHPLTTDEDVAAQEQGDRRRHLIRGDLGAWAKAGEMGALLSIGHTQPTILRDDYDPVTGVPHRPAPRGGRAIDVQDATGYRVGDDVMIDGFAHRVVAVQTGRIDLRPWRQP